MLRGRGQRKGFQGTNQEHSSLGKPLPVILVRKVPSWHLYVYPEHSRHSEREECFECVTCNWRTERSTKIEWNWKYKSVWKYIGETIGSQDWVWERCGEMFVQRRIIVKMVGVDTETETVRLLQHQHPLVMWSDEVWLDYTRPVWWEGDG